tara:strand:+ start:1318 stop:3381 length:2064 start_codon:yes stop_codon:yes gene_type:complete
MAGNYFGNLARATIGQGLGRGWGDELEARIRTLRGPETYEEELAAINKDYNQWYRENTGAALTGEIIGSFLPTLALAATTVGTGGATGPLAVASAQRNLSLANKAKNWVTRNPKKSALAYLAGEGMISGAGRSDVGERIEGGINNIPAALVGGGIGYGLGKGFNAAKDALRNRRGSAIDEVTGELLDPAITDAMAEDQILSALPDPMAMLNIKNLAKEADELGVPLKLLDTDVALANQGKVITRLAQGDVPAIMADTVARNANSAPVERVGNQITKYLGNADFFETNAAVNANKQLAAPKYAEAYAYPSIINPSLLQSFKDNPYMNEAFNKVAKIYNTKSDINVIRGGGNTASSVVPNLNKPSDPISIEFIDGVKKALNGMSGEFRSDGSLINYEKATVQDLSRAMVEIADNATINPNTGISIYSQARKLYGDETEVAKALIEGRKTFNLVQPQELKAYLAPLSDAARDAYRTGAVQNMLEKIRQPSANSNVAQKLIGSTTTKNNIKELFPDKDSSNLLTRALELESQVFAYTSKLLRGSDTVENAVGASKLAQAGEDAFSFLQSGNYSSIVRLVMNSITGPNKLNTIVQEKMAKKLTEGPSGISAVVEALEKRGPVLAKKLANESMVVKQIAGDAATFSSGTETRGDTSVDPVQEELEEINRRYENQEVFGGDGYTPLMTLRPDQQ